MTTIAITGPPGSHAWQAAQLHDSDATILPCPSTAAAFAAVRDGTADVLLLPVYNTREGEHRGFFRRMAQLAELSWCGNVVLPIHLSLGALDDRTPLTTLVGTGSVIRQAEEYIGANFPDCDLLTVQDIDAAIRAIKRDDRRHCGVIEAEELLKARNMVIRDREIASHNRTRYAVIGRQPAPRSGYDATAILTIPLKDRVGLLFDILGEFTRRGINILDLRTDSDVKTQELRIYVEAEGHIDDEPLTRALARIEREIIQEDEAITVLGSFPRVDMRTKLIESFGFIGTGDMSRWFADRLENEGYRTILTGRTSTPTPEEMIPQVDVVVICVPISATAATIRRYGPMLRDGQALILLAGAAEEIVDTAIAHTKPGVEVMLVHNLWGPQAATMKNKTAAVVRTPRSGAFCSEFESFLYKHGADILIDNPESHDLFMGVVQKLPTVISVALARTLAQHNLAAVDTGDHATLTSLYTLLAMARIHAQNDRTYAEIMAAPGRGMAVVRDFVANLSRIQEIAETGDLDKLLALIDENRRYLTDDFVRRNMRLALAVDETLTRTLRR